MSTKCNCSASIGERRQKKSVANTLSYNRSFVNWLQISLYLCWYCNISGSKREWLWIYENHVCELRIKTWIWKRSWAVVQIRPDKNSGLHGIWTYDLYDTGAVLCCTGTPLHRYRRGPMMGSNTIQALVFCYDLFSLLLKWCSLLRRSLSYSSKKIVNLPY